MEQDGNKSKGLENSPFSFYLKGSETNMSVPKCKECEHHKYTSIMVQSRGSVSCSNLKDKHICTMDKIYLEINLSEFKTSPKWCKKRLN